MLCLVMNDAGLILAAALDGQGLAYSADQLVAEHLTAGRLVRVLADACQGSPCRRHVFPANQLAARTIQGPGFGTLSAVFINALSKPTAWMKASSSVPASARGRHHTCSGKIFMQKNQKPTLSSVRTPALGLLAALALFQGR